MEFQSSIAKCFQVSCYVLCDNSKWYSLFQFFKCSRVDKKKCQITCVLQQSRIRVGWRPHQVTYNPWLWMSWNIVSWKLRLIWGLRQEWNRWEIVNGGIVCFRWNCVCTLRTGIAKVICMTVTETIIYCFHLQWHKYWYYWCFFFSCCFWVRRR